ncbi:hypothetical protein ACJX0J_032116, partial [Zea mays]
LLPLILIEFTLIKFKNTRKSENSKSNCFLHGDKKNLRSHIVVGIGSKVESVVFFWDC